jgi:hypothetical protein
MHIELTSGSDSFRASGHSPLRNVQVRLFTFTDEGIMPLFAAFQKKLKGYKESRVIMNIPATERFQLNDVGQWFRTRYEVASSTEILIEYQHRKGNGLNTDTEYLLLKTDPNAPLHHVRLTLDPHPLSAVPYIFFEGRFWIVNDDDQISSPEAWAKHIGLDLSEAPVSYIMDNMVSEPEDAFFTIKEFEAAVTVVSSPQIVTEDGKRKLKRIKRARRIKTK